MIVFSLVKKFQKKSIIDSKTNLIFQLHSNTIKLVAQRSMSYMGMMQLSNAISQVLSLTLSLLTVGLTVKEEKSSNLILLVIVEVGAICQPILSIFLCHSCFHRKPHPVSNAGFGFLISDNHWLPRPLTLWKYFSCKPDLQN